MSFVFVLTFLRLLCFAIKGERGKNLWEIAKRDFLALGPRYERNSFIISRG